MKRILIIPHLEVHNANALSSPYTIGFPAMTAWLGAAHALERKLNASGWKIELSQTGVVCHHMNLQTHKGIGDYVYSIIGTGNPLEPKSEKDNPNNAARPSFIEEGRCHLDVSIAIELSDIDSDEFDKLTRAVSLQLNRMKIAGGDIIRFQAPYITTTDSDSFKTLTGKLMPGYALIERRDLMINAMEQGQDALEAMLDYLCVHNTCSMENDKVTWAKSRKKAPQLEGEEEQPIGWIIPIATGYQGISELGSAKNQRDENTPHRFAESVVTLGEFKMPYRLHSIEDLLWQYHVDEAKKLYLCQQQRFATVEDDDEDYSDFY